MDQSRRGKQTLFWYTSIMKLITKKSLIQRRGYVKNTKGDSLSLYLSNYAVAAEYLAKRIGNKKKTAIELCCGIGITLKQLAKNFQQVIGADNDKNILKHCKQNLRSIKNVKLILSDVNDKKLYQKIKGNIVIYDIPYWYPEKHSKKIINPDLKKVIQYIQKHITKDIVIFTPPEMKYNDIKKIVGECEYMEVYINNKYDRNYIFLGNLIEKTGKTRVNLFTK